MRGANVLVKNMSLDLNEHWCVKAEHSLIYPYREHRDVIKIISGLRQNNLLYRTISYIYINIESTEK